MSETLTQALPTLFTYMATGRLVDFDADKQPVVALDNGQIHVARSCIKLNAAQLGAEVILAIVENKPVITGLIEPEPVEEIPDYGIRDSLPGMVKIKEQIINMNAAERVTIQCGEASITLTKEGKITLRGKYVLSRARKANRIQGGSVELN